MSGVKTYIAVRAEIDKLDEDHIQRKIRTLLDQEGISKDDYELSGSMWRDYKLWFSSREIGRKGVKRLVKVKGFDFYLKQNYY